MAKDYSHLTKEELLDVIQKIESRKKYGLIWDEERTKELFEKESQDALPFLKEVKGKEITGESSVPVNILIEGDNYHALTTLNYTHEGKVDVIYIDPPYNRGVKGGNDFRYNDKFVDSEDPFRHSKWLSFMEKRLRLAKNLLRPAGAIFISIDNTEQSHLKLLCDQVFGEKNFIGILVWRKKEGGGQADAYFVTEHEYIIAYAKSGEFEWIDEKIPVDEETFKKQDDQGKFSAVKLAKWGNTARREDRPKMYFSIKSPDGKNIFPIAPDGGDGRWRVGKKRMEMLIEKDLVFWQKKDARWLPYEKIYFNEDEVKTIKERSILYDLATTADGTNELTEIFGKKDIFENPKPTELIKFFLRYGAKSNAIILDFFAGSGTTGQAVMSLNQEDKGERRFILCTNNENKIAEDVCYPRIQKVMNGYKVSNKKVKGLGGNLRYFKTAFVKRSICKDNLKVRITRECTELLCLREAIFEEKKKTDDYRIFEQSGRILAAYYSINRKELKSLKKELDKMNGKKILYCFTLDAFGLHRHDFDGWDDVALEPIPQKILDIYEGIYEH